MQSIYMLLVNICICEFFKIQTPSFLGSFEKYSVSLYLGISFVINITFVSMDVQLVIFRTLEKNLNVSICAVRGNYTWIF